MVLAQAYANTGDTLDPHFIQHQRIEHNFKSSHELLKELDADLTDLRLLRAKGEEVLEKMNMLISTIEQGEMDKDGWMDPGEAWCSPVVNSSAELPTALE